MDNNNSIPYGSISPLNDQYNTLSDQRHYSPSNSTPVNDNLQDPIAVARNFNPSEARNMNITNSWSGNERHNSPFTNQISNGVPGFTGVGTSSATNGSHNSLIKHESINMPSLNTSELTNGTRTGNLFGINRYFQVPWSVNGITHAETPHTNTYRPLDYVSGRPLVQLPTLTEQNPTQSRGYANNPSRRCKKHSGIKRRVSKDDSEDGLPRPASKLLLTEEKMAAKMHNLSISNDHSYHMNGLPTQLSLAECNSISHSMLESESEEDDDVKEEDNNNMGSANSSVFVLAPGVKEMLDKNDEIIPRSLLEEMSKPCLAVIPWKPPDEVVGNVLVSFNFNNKTDDEKMAENEKHQQNNVKENQLFTFGNCNCVDHTEVIEDYQTFEFDDDDMDL